MKIQLRPVWDRGTAVKEAPWNGHGGGMAGQAVHIAAEATGGTGSLIKNTAPFQQLWPSPKWNHTQKSKESRRPGDTALSGHRGKVIFSCQTVSQSRKCWTFKTQSRSTRSQRNSHINCFQFSQTTKSLSRFFLPWRAFESSQSSPYLVCHARHTTANQAGNAGVHRQSYVYMCVCER